MTLITIDYKFSNEAVQRVQNLLSLVARCDPDWHDTKFIIKRDNYTSIDGGGAAQAASLYVRVSQALEGAVALQASEKQSGA